MHAAGHRVLRELFATARQMAEHWSSLAGRLGSDDAAVMREGADAAAELLGEVRAVAARRDVFSEIAAQGVGSTLSVARAGLGDRFLERNQALRLAVLDAQHVVTLLAYLDRLAAGDRDVELAAFCAGWARRLGAFEDAARKAAIASGDDPDLAIHPVDGSLLGRAAHKVAEAAGTVGEWVDRTRATVGP